MKKIISLLIAGMLTLGITTTAFAKSTNTTINSPRSQIRMMVIDPDDGPPK